MFFHGVPFGLLAIQRKMNQPSIVEEKRGDLYY